MIGRQRFLERIVKGFANHRRIEILELLQRESDLSLEAIAETLHINVKTACEHTARLERSGLVTKRYRGRAVVHRVTDRAREVLSFLSELN